MKQLLEEEGGKEKVVGRLDQRPGRDLLEHIIQQVFNICDSLVSSINYPGVQQRHLQPRRPEPIRAVHI